METGGKRNKDIKYISVLSVVSCIAVVYLHANSCFWSFSTERYWKTANVIEAVMYFAVPIFFMITGTTVLDYQERYGLKVYFKKRIKKTFIPFILWSLIGIVYLLVRKKISLDDVQIRYIVKDIISAKYISVYWFFPLLFCIYLCIPILAAVEKDKKESIYKYAVICGLILNVLIPFLCRFPVFDFIPNSVSITIITGYVLFVLSGYVLNKHDFTLKGRLLIYCAALAGLLIHIIGTYSFSMRDGEINRTFKEYTNLPSVLYAIGVFVLFKYISPKLLKLRFIEKLVNILKKYTFSIYLLHWYIIDITVGALDINTRSIIYRLIAPLLIVPICCFITWVMRKIPIINIIVPE